MMDYQQIDYNIRKHNYSLWRLDKNRIDIIKNEHGTYGEFNDFIVSTQFDPNTGIILQWKVNINNDHIKQTVITFLETHLTNKQITFEELCLQLANKL